MTDGSDPIQQSKRIQYERTMTPYKNFYIQSVICESLKPMHGSAYDRETVYMKHCSESLTIKSDLWHLNICMK